MSWISTFNVPRKWKSRASSILGYVYFTCREYSSKWYCKQADTGLVKKIPALGPTEYQRLVVKGSIHQIYRSCSSWVFSMTVWFGPHDLNKHFENSTRNILQKYNYPWCFHTNLHFPLAVTGKTASSPDLRDEDLPLDCWQPLLLAWWQHSFWLRVAKYQN